MTKDGRKKIEKNSKEKELEEKLRQLALDIDKVEDEKLEIQNQLKKALADYHNLLRDVGKRQELQFFQLKKTLCEDVIPSLDAIYLAIKSGEEMKLGEKEKAWMDGIAGILENLEKSFERIGLKQYWPQKGENFDSSVHEAVAVVEQGESGKIFDVLQPGYTLDDTVVRQARVVVSK